MKPFEAYKHFSIRTKIIVMVLSVVFVVMSIGFLVIAAWNMNKLKRDLQANLAMNTKLIGDYCVVPLFFGDVSQASESLLRLKLLESVKEGYLLDKKGKLFASYPDSSTTNLALKTLNGSEFQYNDGDLIITERIQYQGMPLGTIVVKASTGILQATRNKLIVSFSYIMLLLLVMTYFIATKVQKNISNPILHLAEQTKSISKSQDFSIRLTPPGSDEIGTLYRQYNNLLAQLYKREKERDKAEKELLHVNANLEKLVQERTVRLEEANKGLEAFSYSISHDLRAPLRHVNGYLELLKKRNLDQLDEKGIHYMEAISEASNKMGQLIDDLLNFSRAGRSELKIHRMCMDKAVKEALLILEPEMKDRTIEWTIEELPEVDGDFAMLRQVWVNLIGNAIKYSKYREVATIRIGHLSKETEEVFFIQDNGAGFDMKYAQKLFGVFQRMHSSEDFDGTGIGLANVRQVITRHKGQTWAEGELDKGATFYFSLPKTT